MRRLWPLAILLIGCGGNGSGDRSFIDGTVGTASIQFAGSAATNGDAYNGNATALTTAALTGVDGSASVSVITITATANDRAVEAVVVARNVRQGQVISVSEGGADSLRGSEVVYTDTTGRRYQAISGTLTVQSRSASGVTLRLTNVVCEPNASTGDAKGLVTLNGTLSFNAS